MDLGKIQELTDTTPRGMNRRWLDGDEFFPPRARRWGRRHRRGSARKQIAIRQSGRRVLMIQDRFWLLLGHDTGTETKANGGRRIGTIVKHF